MTLEQLRDALIKLGAKRDGAVVKIPADADVTVLVALEGETLSVPRVVRVDTNAAPVLLAECQRGELFVFDVESVCAVKVERSEAARRERGAGFVK
jgi:hypothetical protein